MTDDAPRTARPLRTVTATATATGSALAVVLLPIVVGALFARSMGGDPMVSVNALIAGGGQRARISRSQLRVSRGRAVARARGAWDQSPLRARRRPVRRPSEGVAGPARCR